MAKKSDSIDFDSSGLPEEYRSIYEANPFADVDVKGGFLGIGRKKALQEMNLEARKYAANVMQQAYSEDYNSPEEQVQRLRNAGINPDLSGGISAGESSGNPLSAGDVEFADPAKQIADFSSFLLNVASLAMSFPESLAAAGADRLAQSLSLASAGSELAQAFPDSTVNIAPTGLAPVLVKNGVSGDMIAGAIPGLSGRQRKMLGRNIELNRSSLKNSLSSARDRKSLNEVLSSPALSMPKEAAEAIKLEGKLTLIKLKGEFKKQMIIEKYRSEVLENEAKAGLSKSQNDLREQEVVTEELGARSASASAERVEAGARKAVAGAEVKEARLRGDIADATDADKVAASRNAEAELSKVEDETSKEQLEAVEAAEDAGLFGSSLIGDLISIGLDPTKSSSQKMVEVYTRNKLRRSAKRKEKRKYGRSSSSTNIKVGKSGVSYSDN